jgi:inhibitor of KinA
MRIEPLGDSALLIRVVEEFEPEQSLDAVLRTAQALELAAIPGVVELVPAYTTVAVFCDPARTEAFDDLQAGIERALERDSEYVADVAARAIIEVPVCYEAEFAADLDEVARHTGLAREEIVRRHSGATYRVSCVGSMPGFPYLTGLPSELSTPRRASPRKEVPAGAVAIGGCQTGIYPRKSPGGWNIIGRTPLRLFDVARNPPAFFRTRDRVRFRAISRQQFDALSA